MVKIIQEDAEKIVKYSKYPPRGTRGYGPMFAPHAMPGVASGEQHDAHADDSLIVAVQIESRSGVENVEKIAAVDGLDVLLIGMSRSFIPKIVGDLTKYFVTRSL
jgi:4-hydroxy-2-oxoheptanedioate aldolase